MAQLIDELIVALKLDPKNFNKGQKEAGAAFLKTRDQAIKSGKEIEAASNKVAASISKIAREVIVLFGAIAGARSLKDLVAGLTSANAELGRFSANMAESPQTLAAWGAAAQRFGGTGTATAETIQKMGKALYDLRYQGKALPQAFYQLEAATGRLISTDKGPVAFLEQTAAALKQLAARDPSRAFNIAQELGIDNGTFNLMKAQGAAIHDFVAEIEKSISPSNKAIESAQKLQAAWATFVQQMGAAANKLYETLGPPISELIDKMNKWVEANREWLASGITDAVKQFADALSKVNWTDVSNGFGNFSRAAADTAASIKAIIDGIATMSTWFTGTPLRAPGTNPNWEKDWKEQLGGKGAADLPVERPLNPGVLNEWLNGKPGSDKSNTTVDGRPVSKSNPLPVAPVSADAGGGGFWSNLWKGITGAMSGASAGFMSGGSSLMSAGSGSGGGGSGGSNASAAASVPNIPGMTADERNKLGLILKYESRGRNVMNYMGRGQGIDPSTAKGYTAQGYYQILNSNWRRLAPKLGITARNAMAASLEDQTKVALALMRESGIKNWSNFNPQLRTALQRGEKAGSWGERVPIDVATGAKGSAAISSANNDNRRYGNNNVSSNMTIGNMNIQTQASDPHGIADVIWGDIDQRMKQSANATAANYGPA